MPLPALSLIALIISMLYVSPVKADNSRAQLFDAIGQRLGLMKAVAQTKFEQGLPIEDLEREAVVISAAVAGSTATGLTTDSAQRFFEAQIKAAKIIQAYWFEHWERQPPVSRSLDLATELRPKLLVLGDQITQQLGTPVTDQDFMDFMRATDIEGLNRDQRAALFQELKDLKSRSKLEQIQRAGILRVGTTLDYPPFSSGSVASPKGIDIQLAMGLADHLGVKVQWVQTTWPSLMTDFSQGLFDLGLSGISITPERAQLAAFSIAYHVGGKTPIGRCKDRNRYQTFDAIDRPETRVIVNPGGTNERFVRRQLKQAKVQIFDDNRLIFNEIIADRADVMFTDEIEVILQTAKASSLCALLPGERLTHQEKGILMPKDRSIVTVVNRWLNEQIAMGHVQTLKAEYLAALQPDS